MEKCHLQLKKSIVITGSEGQLGKCLQQVSKFYPQYEFFFLNKDNCDITSYDQVKDVFTSIDPDYVINAAAYTAVDKAESEPDNAYAINAYALRNIGHNLAQGKCIHISTDYVYHNDLRYPMSEDAVLNPQGIYAKSKLLGEKIILSSPCQSMIIRASWVYSAYGSNFVKTMLRLSESHSEIGVVNDQIGSPTYGIDLALCIMDIIKSDDNSLVAGDGWNHIYNFSNEGKISWYDFAVAIFEKANVDVSVRPITTSQYPTPASRPPWSVLDTTRIKKTFGVKISPWNVSLEKCIHDLFN
jgi:dTDP-4-dehydrorhamnose reductase